MCFGLGVNIFKKMQIDANNSSTLKFLEDLRIGKVNSIFFWLTNFRNKSFLLHIQRVSKLSADLLSYFWQKYHFVQKDIAQYGWGCVWGWWGESLLTKFTSLHTPSWFHVYKSSNMHVFINKIHSHILPTFSMQGGGYNVYTTGLGVG